jgi:hypothetical protein
LCMLGIQDVEFCFFLVVLFFQVWLQHLSKIFDLWSSHCLFPPSSCNLESLSNLTFLSCNNSTFLC